jgi:hypothetical protein
MLFGLGGTKKLIKAWEILSGNLTLIVYVVTIQKNI